MKKEFDHTILLLTPLYGEGEAQSVVRILFEDVFGMKKNAERVLKPEERMLLDDLSARLLNSEPLQYVLGQADFFGMKLHVSPAVLIPRQETEELVAWGITCLKTMHLEQPRVLDVGTGSGCIALAIKKHLPHALVTALDVSAEALEVARQNSLDTGLQVDFLQADVLDNGQWPLGPFDLIVSNPPYVTPSETSVMSAWVQGREPDLALYVPEDDPMLFYRALADMGNRLLAPDRALLAEVNEFRANAVQQLWSTQGYVDVQCKTDISGAKRMVYGAFSGLALKK
ncbi:MAG: peptide chain release factor N(5)-glutamine methyltransferase [Saprospiraceae bacterium]